MYIGLHVKYRLILSYFTATRIFWTYFRKNFIKTRPVGAELLHADELTDRRTERKTDLSRLIAVLAILRRRIKIQCGVQREQAFGNTL
jgi:hypothetical protein